MKGPKNSGATPPPAKPAPAPEPASSPKPASVKPQPAKTPPVMSQSAKPQQVKTQPEKAPTAPQQKPAPKAAGRVDMAADKQWSGFLKKLENSGPRTAKQIGKTTRGLDDPKRIPVGAKDAKSLVRAEGGSTRNVGKVAGDKAFKHTDRNGLKRTYVDPSHNGYRKTASKTLGDLKGRDVDHSLNKKNAERMGVKSATAKLDPSVNRAHGKAEQVARPGGEAKNGVVYANNRELHKLQGHKPPKKAEPGSERAIVHGHPGKLTHSEKGRIAKALGLDQQVTKKPPIAKASDIRKPSKKPGV